MARDGASPLPPRPERPMEHRAGLDPSVGANPKREGRHDRGRTQATDLSPENIRDRKASRRARPQSAGAPQSFVRRFVPNSRGMLALLDVVFLGVAQAIVFGRIQQRLDFSGLAQARCRGRDLHARQHGLPLRIRVLSTRHHGRFHDRDLAPSHSTGLCRLRAVSRAALWHGHS